MPRRPAEIAPLLAEVAAVLVVLAAVSVGLLPLLRPGLPATHDGFLHLQRIVALDAALRDGALLTRWLPDLAYGYGQPLFLYYAPLAYAPAVLARLAGAGFVASLELSSAGAIVASALAMYALARRVGGHGASAVAAIVYGTLPYQLVDLYVRGALAESWAFAWLPACALCLIRGWFERRARWHVALAVSVCGLVLTHNVTALLFLPALVALAVGLQLGYGGRSVPPWRPVAALGLGLGLSAWFWLPALAERGLVQIQETIEPALTASFFLTSWPPFRLDPVFDYGEPVSAALGYPIFWPQLGLVQALVTLAGIGALLLGLRPRGHRAGAAGDPADGGSRTGPPSGRDRAVVGTWAVLLVVGGIVLQTAPAAPLYAQLPLLAFVQFPWRLLAVVGLGSAILAGVAVEAAGRGRAVRVALATLVVGGSLIAATGRLDPPVTPVADRFLSAETVLRAELADYGLGTTHSGEYLPVASEQRNAARVRKTILDARPSRPSAPMPADDLRIGDLIWRADRIELRTDGSQAARLTLHQFAFPGWIGRVDGIEVPLQRADSLGLIALDLPAGSHTVDVRWSLTPFRAVTAGISAGSLALLAGLVLSSNRRSLPRRRAAARAGLAAGIVLAIASGGPTAHVRDSRAASTTAPARQDLGDGLAVVAAEVDTSRLTSDRLLSARLVWHVRQAPTTGIRASLEAIGSDGRVHGAPWVYEPLSGLWNRDELVPTTVVARLPADFPAGSASLRLTFQEPPGLAPVALGRVEIPAPPSSVASATDAATAEVWPGLTVQVAGADAPSSARPGGPLDITLRWAATAPAQDRRRELYAVAAVTGAAGELLSEPGRPGDWFAPLPFWQAGDRVEQRLRVMVPGGLAAGTYPVVVRLYARDLARGGMSESGASAPRLRGQPLLVLDAGSVAVAP